MSWSVSKATFDDPDGTRLLLQRLASSPLVRKTLPNAAAICQQYFSFRRSAQESIGNFLVRETLVHEEFVEAIIRLHEEKLGVSQDQRDYGLPDPTYEEDSWSPWWDWPEEDDDREEEPTDETADPGAEPAATPTAGATRATTGSSPSHRGDGAAEAAEEKPKSSAGGAIDELSVADSFIMGVLRGWRLLQAAGLTAEEKRDILSTTKNSLEYETVASALQSLWDEQLLGHRGHRATSGFHLNLMDQNVDEETYGNYDDDWSWGNSDDGGWYDSYYAYEDPQWWSWDEEQGGDPPHTIAEAEIEDPALKEAQQAEQVAEALALEAQRTWSQAQKATQALRKDRGFGAVTGRPQPNDGRCFICGGPHLQRDCPDLRHRQNMKGKGKMKGFWNETDDYYANFSSFGKSKSKGKSKKGHWMDVQGLWKGKGKGPKGKTKDGYGTVNAYSSEMFLGGLEVIHSLDLAASSTSATSSNAPQLGMLDCGATASAAPEAVVKGLISSVLSIDRGARIDIDQYSQPFFRFGNGKWGKALCRVLISSSSSGRERQFALYTLPNPAEYFQNKLDKASLVPVLIGMDFLGPQGQGMMIDFNTGLAMFTKTSDPRPPVQQLQMTSKGHYVLNLATYLTGGRESPGHPQVVVHKQSAASTTLSSQLLELGTVYFDMSASDHVMPTLTAVSSDVMSESLENMYWLLDQSRQLNVNSATADSAQMTGPSPTTTPATSPSRSPHGHVDPRRDDCQRGNLRGRDQVEDSQSQGEGDALRLRTESQGRQPRPQSLEHPVAVFQQACGGLPEGQRTRTLDPLLHLQSSPGVRSSPGEPWTNDTEPEPSNGPSDADAVAAVDGSQQAHGSYLLGDATQDRRRGATDTHDQRAQERPNEDESDGTTDGEPGRILQQQLADDGRHGGHQPGNGLRGGRLPRTAVTVDKKVTPNYVGRRIMQLAAMMTATTSNLLCGLHLQNHDGVWEVACSPHSWLSEACEQHGLQPRRINYQEGYDLYMKETWHRLRDLYLKKRPRRIWFSLPCTKWCPWTSVNYNTPEKQETLEAARRKERKLLWEAASFIKYVLEVDDEVKIYFEWPHPCFGWKQQPMVNLERHLEATGYMWMTCRVDGCNYGMKNSDDGAFIRKKWMIKTNDENFHKNFRAKVCPGNHQHVTIEGNLTSQTACYPWRMVQAIARHWRDQTTPARHLRLLHQQLVERDEEDETPLPPNDLTYHELDPAPEVELENPRDELPEGLYTITATEIQSAEHFAQAAMNEKDFHFVTLERLLMMLRPRSLMNSSVHHRGTQPGVNSLLFGAFSHGNFRGITRRTMKFPQCVLYINKFLQHDVPDGTWSSFVINFDCQTRLHCDHHNARGSYNHLVGTGTYSGGGLWLQGQPPDGYVAVKRRSERGYMMTGYVLPTKYKVVTFDPFNLHATQSWTGLRLSVSAYTTRLAAELSEGERKMMNQLGFRLREAGPTRELQAAMEHQESRGEVPPQEHQEPQESPGEVPQEPQEPQESPGGSVRFSSQTESEELQSVPQHERQAWEARVAKFHKAAGHPTNKNLARIIADAGHPRWKSEVALQHRCPACESLRKGGDSSGQVPPVATHQQYAAWQAVAVDAGEWIPPKTKVKVKFLVFMDVATKLRVIHPLFTYGFLEMRAESGQDLIRSFSERWLGLFPKPKFLLLDSAKSFSSEMVHDFLSEINVTPHYVAEKESWAHGVIEASMMDIKHTASAIHMEDLSQDPMVTLQLTASALNSTETTAGFSANQWAFGTEYNVTDEDIRTYETVEPRIEFTKLVTARVKAEEVARTNRGKRVLSRLANTTVRQPLRTFQTMDLVKVWRRVWPQEQHKGPRGGFKKSGRPHWIGPGRVVFHEVLPHQDAGDDRRHIVWVLIGSQLLRCSVHSVRMATETERFEFESSKVEDPTKWRTLADILPAREYQDLTDQVPGEGECELPPLPQRPDSTTTMLPRRRAVRKTTFQPGDYVVPQAVQDRLRHEEVEEDMPPNEPGQASTTTPSTTRPMVENPVNDYEPEPKRLRSEGLQSQQQLTWVEALRVEAAEEERLMDIHTAIQQAPDFEEFLKIEFDLGEGLSNRQYKQLARNPVLYMTKKMRDCEVTLTKLSEPERRLFARAKSKEVDSFIKNEAVRACLDQKEIKEAYTSGRIIKARWVLTWKLVPTEEQAEAREDAMKNPNTMHSKDGKKKAKARIVLLGYQHPSLLDSSFKTASPVQSLMGRNLLYLMSVQHQWPLEGLDLATAFLQTQPTEADRNLWTTGVEELRTALGIDGPGLMRILKNVYGSTTAPRGLWLDLHKTLTKLGGVPVLGERCLWIWKSQTEMDNGKPRVIGAMGGHVDDFHRLGDNNSEEWKAIKVQVDTAYKWGTAKTGSYRHAGTDVVTSKDADGNLQVTVDQDYYVDALQDINIDPDRINAKGQMNKAEFEACRTSLGALQWLAIQTQPQLCSRYNLLLTELVTQNDMETAREIQAMIGEVRQEPFRLHFRKLKDVKHWSDMVFVSMGDQAHNNRPKGESTGGLITMAAGPSCVNGAISPMILLSWRSWKLKRRAIGSNDAEIQAVLEAEDNNFRLRLLWSELHGAGGLQERELRQDLVEQVENQTLALKGIVCTDSRGGYDAIEVNESPLLGLSNMRAALQAFQLRDNLRRAGCTLRWLASDYDLADALTKKRADSRYGLVKFLRTGLWSIKFDPSFTSSKKSKQMGKSAIADVDNHLRQNI